MNASRIRVCVLLFLPPLFAGPAASQSAEVVSLMTKDGVRLTLTYYPGARRTGTAEAKQTTPVVLLHDYKETRAIFNSLAQRLQAPAEGEKRQSAFAAVAVDLRAHGDSTTQVLADGSQVNLDSAKLNKQDLLAMATLDIEAVRSFLVGKNDAGELNLNKLCIVGAGMGANVAANWALQDWTSPPLAIGKQGQDVKALVFISPRWTYSGLSFQQPMRFRPLKENVAWLLMYGAEDAKVKADALRIHKQLERFHPEAKETAAQRSSDLLVVAWPSKLQGGTLLRQVGAPIEQQIVDFLDKHVANKNVPWANRRGRLP